MQKNVAPSDTMKRMSLDIILGTKRTYCFNDDLARWLVKIDFGVLVLKRRITPGFTALVCNVSLLLLRGSKTFCLSHFAGLWIGSKSKHREMET